MKITLLAVAACMTFAASAAFAGEGNGDPFPFRAPGVVSKVGDWKGKTNKDNDPFPFRADAQALSKANTLLPPNGSEGAMQTANSLPAGFQTGTPTYEQAQRVADYMQQTNPARTQLSQQATPAPHG